MFAHRAKVKSCTRKLWRNVYFIGNFTTTLKRFNSYEAESRSSEAEIEIKYNTETVL